MIRTATLFAALLLASVAAVADQITFSFVSGSGNGFAVNASSSGLTAGPGVNVLATDSKTGVSIPLPGIVAASTGAASSFTVLPNAVLAQFDAGGANSVSIVDPITMLPILTGTSSDGSTLVATYPGGTGAFLSGFQVTFISPTVLADFGLSGVDPRGSLGITFGQDQVVTKDLTAVGGGGTITVVGTPIIEASTIFLFGTGIVLCGGGLKLRRMLT